MNAVPERWLNCREREFIHLQRLLQSSTGFVHLQGSRGCGKSSLVRDVAHGQNAVTVDATLSTSVPALMSCILRRIHDKLKVIRNTGSPETDDEVDVKSEEKVLVKKESPLSTPDKVPSRSELMEECSDRGSRRNAAIIAQKKIVALSNRRGGAIRKLVDDDFLDEDYSEESDSSDSSSDEPPESRQSVAPKRINRRNDNIVNPDIYRILARAQKLRVRGVSAFIQKLERVLIQPTEPTRLVLIIENVDTLISPSDHSFDISPSPGAEFLTLLTRLDEYLSVPLIDLSIIVTSTHLLPPSISARAASVSLHPYSLSESVAILSRIGDRHKLYPAFVAGTCAILYPSMCNNFVLLRDTVERLFTSWSTKVVDIKLIASTALINLFNETHHDGSFASDEKALTNLICSVKWLSQDARRILVAAYLAAHNPAQHDKQIFRVIGNDQSRSKKQGVSQFKKYRTMADSIDIRTPVPFPLSRLLSIYRFLCGHPEQDMDEDAGYFFHKTVRELTQNGLLKAGGGNGQNNDWWIQNGSGAKLNCNAPFSLIEEIAKKLNIKLDEVLYA